MNDQRRTRAAVAILARLSDREVEVFTRLGRGDSTVTIAADLNLSRSSVATYRRRVLSKLVLSSTIDLVILAHRLGLAKRARVRV